jgi:tRNA (guanine-N7-)-methyltransferase
MRVRQHVNPLKSDFFTIAPAPVVVPAGVPLEVELGSAEAWFLMDRARQEPTGFYLGVEIRRELVAKAKEECARAGLAQVHSVFANMSVDLPRLLPPGRVRRFFLNFPDPWFKKPQHKRRVLCPALIEDLAGLLSPEGELYVNSDMFEHALDAMFLLESDRGQRFENLRAPWSFLPDNPFAARSRREIQCERDGVKVWRLGYRRRGGQQPPSR